MSEAKNEYEIKREERERSREDQSSRQRKDKIKKKLKRYGISLAILVLVGYGIVILARNTEPKGEDFSIAYPDQEGSHIAVGAIHIEYNSNPPSSGPHYAQTARGGFYGDPLPDEQVVHNLEHGDIWIAYHPGISNEAREALESFASSYVVVSPRDKNEGDISLVAWGRVDTFNIENGIVDEERIKDFIRRYDNRGPENVRGIQNVH